VAILNDVSRFKMLEQVKNEFITTATHGLKNTLTKIALMSQLVPKLGPLNEKQAEYLGNISHAAANMDKLVQNMLELARIDAGGLEFKRASVNVNQLASGIAEEFQVQAKAAELSLQFEPAEGDPEIQADQFPCRPARMASQLL
jgi:signal transduction histidine kinase